MDKIEAFGKMFLNCANLYEEGYMKTCLNMFKSHKTYQKIEMAYQKT